MTFRSMVAIKSFLLGVSDAVKCDRRVTANNRFTAVTEFVESFRLQLKTWRGRRISEIECRGFHGVRQSIVNRSHGCWASAMSLQPAE